MLAVCKHTSKYSWLLLLIVKALPLSTHRSSALVRDSTETHIQRLYETAWLPLR